MKLKERADARRTIIEKGLVPHPNDSTVAFLPDGRQVILSARLRKQLKRMVLAGDFDK
jgi:hypothetical protein